MSIGIRWWCQEERPIYTPENFILDHRYSRQAEHSATTIANSVILLKSSLRETEAANCCPSNYPHSDEEAKQIATGDEG